MRLRQGMLVLIFLLMTSSAIAEELFDGTKTLLCASVEAMDCVSGESCVRGLPEVIGAPQFLRIDFAGKKIIGPKHTTAILKMEKEEGQILLQGIELNMGWVFALNQTTGRFTATLADEEGAFVIFGACTPL